MQDLTAGFFGTGIVTRDPDSHPKACGFLHGVIRCTWKEGLTASPLLGHSCSCLEPEARVPHHPLRSAGDVLLSLRLQNQASLCGQAAAWGGRWGQPAGLGTAASGEISRKTLTQPFCQRRCSKGNQKSPQGGLGFEC